MVQKLLGAIVHAALGASIWYMSTEIGARNFGDVQRYNLLPVIAKRLGLIRGQNYRCGKIGH